jgi:hypothetical protein
LPISKRRGAIPRWVDQVPLGEITNILDTLRDYGVDVAGGGTAGSEAFILVNPAYVAQALERLEAAGFPARIG